MRARPARRATAGAGEGLTNLRAVLRLAAALFASAALLALAGCGSREPSDEEKVRATLTAFADATAQKDYQRLCDEIFARELLRGISEIGLPCEVAMRQSLKDVENPRLTVGRVSVKGSRASAEVRTAADGQAPSRDTVRLVKTDEQWRVSSLGEAEGPEPRPEPTTPSGPTAPSEPPAPAEPTAP